MTLKIRMFPALLAGTAMLAMVSPLAAQDLKEREPGKAGEQAEETASAAGETIVVTGTRIRGARSTGDVFVIDRETIVDAGQVDLGEAIRSLPQNFGGGQNPGVGPGTRSSENVNSASSANLRGLGADATLTLLNGHRLPYDSAIQAIDISAIPLAAVERIDVVPDGASALYGSDAVGGVVNVILRRDFEGVTTSAQIGASTAGGNFRQQADIVAGTGWDRGGVVLAYDFANNSSIRANQRPYTAMLLPDATLYPETWRHAVTLFAHHELAPGVEAGFDALYSSRESRMKGGTEQRNLLFSPSVETYTFAPSLRFDLGSGWQANAVGVFGRDHTRYHTLRVPDAGPPDLANGHYYNEVVSFEGGLEGPVFTLPGGDARLAIGAGIRVNSLDAQQHSITYDSTVKAESRARFAYAEINLPFVSASNAVDGIRELTLSAAGRLEDYADLESQVMPRIGLTWSPFDTLTFRGSWARSFKAPALFQQHTFYQTILLPAAAFGVGSPGDTVLYTGGGNENVGPEKARSWSAGFEFNPVFAEGLSVSASWFDVDYKDRVARPVTGSLSSVFGNPGYANQIMHSPDQAVLDRLIAGALMGLENYTGAPFDPSNVIAVVNNRFVNIGEWSASGIDARIGYSRELTGDRFFSLDLNASWLASQQRVAAGLPEVELAGTVFSPPRIRMRSSARFRSGSFSINGAINYVGELVDQRFDKTHRLAPNATIDLGLRYTIIEGEGRDPGLEISLSLQNVFDDEPEAIGQTGPTDTPYDSTNYSPIGRFVAFGIRRHW